MSDARTPAPAVRSGSFEGVDAVELDAGGYTATFLPDLGMLGASLTYDGQQLLSLHGGVDGYRAGHTTGLPLLHPWANRLSRFGYEVQGRWVDFTDAPPVHTVDGLPIHGTMTAVAGWSVEAQFADSTRAMVQARFPFGEHPEQLRSFPFPHDLVLFAELSDLGLRVSVTIHATGDVEVPVSFGWHPYLVLPGVERRDLTLILPDREHLELNLRKLPTGTSTHEAAAAMQIGAGEREVTFDDSYRLVGEGREARTLAIEGAVSGVPDAPRRRLSIELDDSYRYAQVYAPSGEAFVALEPMTAPTNALDSGDHQMVPPGESWTASFVIRLDTIDPPAATP